MGFSSEAIFINSELSEPEEKEVLDLLGFSDYKKLGKARFDEADSGRLRNGVYVGKINGSTFFIFEGAYQSNRDKNNLSENENKLASRFPNKDILTIMNYEIANSYGYAYIKNGQLVRLKEGAHPDVSANFGNELEIERNYYVKKQQIDNCEYFLTESSQSKELNKWTHDQIGGSIAFELVKLMTGKNYMSDKMFRADIDNYIPEASYNQLKKAFNDSSIEIPKKFQGSILTTHYNLILEKARKAISVLGLTEIEKGVFIKNDQGLRFKFNLKAPKENEIFASPYISFNILCDRTKWYKETFGRDKFHYGNSVNNIIPIKPKRLGLPEQSRNPFWKGENYHYQEVEEAVLKIINEIVIPYFQKLPNLNAVAEHCKGFNKIDLLCMSNQEDRAKEYFKEALSHFAEYTLEENSHKSLIPGFIEEYKDRANLLGIQINVEDFIDNYTSQHNQRDIKEKGFKNDPTPKPKNTNPWWKFW
ncbi:hypothetical protein OO013_07725 [Mangrovivirga sp. M17]|uniref:Uncharacterized protein n=1 Tax=Mangrovivirga halotolerans TaxID=2993936 RepID=A0ABT3RQD3_9BACT|nr:hypothetical protein [Mangrovivirga halotolerans]MCX2743748.1 hypothetical protein [Mangrovivirga halotolerans]